MTDISEMFTSSSPYSKAAEMEGCNIQGIIEHAGVDEVQFKDDKPEKVVFIKVRSMEKPLKLSKTNGRTLIGAFGNETTAWINQNVVVTTRPYQMESGRVVGFIVTPLLAPVQTENPAPFDDNIPQ
jgi:hypothetical protein